MRSLFIYLDIDKAIADFTKLIKMKPKVPCGYYSRGWVYTEKGEYDRAIADFTRAIDLGDIYCHLNRGSAYAKTGKKFEAIAEFTEFIRLSEDPELVEEARQEVERLHT